MMKKYLAKWKFLTVGGWDRRQQTIYAESKLEAEKQMYPYTFGTDKMISITEIK